MRKLTMALLAASLGACVPVKDNGSTIASDPIGDFLMQMGSQPAPVMMPQTYPFHQYQLGYGAPINCTTMANKTTCY